MTMNPDPLEVWKEALAVYEDTPIAPDPYALDQAAAAIIAQHYAPVIAEVERLRGEVARMNACFSPDVRAVMGQLTDGEIVYPIAQISSDAAAESGLNISDKRTRSILRALHTLGLADFGSLVSEDDNQRRGCGYWISGTGYAARQDLGEKS